MGFCFFKNRTMFSSEYLRGIWAAQKNSEAARWRDRNLLFHVAAGRTGLVMTAVATIWIDPAIVGPVFSVNIIAFMFLRHLDRESHRSEMRLGWLGWLIAAGAAFGVALALFSENGRAEIADLLNWGLLLLAAAVVLDAYNVERSLKMIEASYSENSLYFGFAVTGGLHFAIGLILLPFSASDIASSSPMPVMTAFLLSVFGLGSAAMTARYANLKTFRLESNIIIQSAEILGLFWIWAATFTGWTEFAIARKDWLVMGVLLIAATCALSQISLPSMSQKSEQTL